jgi:hypothetical protein
MSFVIDPDSQKSTTAIVPTKKKRTYNSGDLDLSVSNSYAFVSAKMEEFLKWRRKLEESMNLYLRQANIQFDDLIKSAHDSGALADEESLYDFLTTFYQDTGARNTMKRIDNVIQAFKRYWQAKNNKKAGHES